MLAQQRLQAKVESFRTRKETIKANYTAAEAQTKIGEALYAQAQSEGADGAQPGAEGAQAKDDDDIVDAEVVDDDNDGKK